MPADYKKAKRLGELLIEYGVLKPEHLDEALAIQKKEGGLLGEILVKRGFVTEENVVVALAEQLDYPYLPVPNFVPSAAAVKALPAALAVEYVCVPVDKVGQTLSVVMSDPTNQTAVREIERASGCRVQAFVGLISEITAAIERAYKRKPGEAQLTKLEERLKRVLHQAVNSKKPQP